MELPAIKSVMDERGLSYKALAERAGLSPQTVARAIKTGQARASTCAKIVGALEMDSSYAEETDNKLPLWFAEAERSGARYTVRETTYTFQVYIEHPTRGPLVRATESVLTPGGEKIVRARAERFNASIGSNTQR